MMQQELIDRLTEDFRNNRFTFEDEIENFVKKNWEKINVVYVFYPAIFDKDQFANLLITIASKVEFIEIRFKIMLELIEDMLPRALFEYSKEKEIMQMKKQIENIKDNIDAKEREKYDIISVSSYMEKQKIIKKVYNSIGGNEDE